MKVNIKRFSNNAVIPKYAKLGDAGMDLVATSVTRDSYGNYIYGTGLGFEIPEGYVGLIFERSSNLKKDLCLTNAVGVIDSGYRGEVKFFYRPTKKKHFWQKTKIYEVGDRVGQIIILPYPNIEFNEVDELSVTERGTGGFGSSGK